MCVCFLFLADRSNINRNISYTNVYLHSLVFLHSVWAKVNSKGHSILDALWINNTIMQNVRISNRNAGRQKMSWQDTPKVFGAALLQSGDEEGEFHLLVEEEVKHSQFQTYFRMLVVLGLCHKLLLRFLSSLRPILSSLFSMLPERRLGS